MAFTSHGYHIPGSAAGIPPEERARCGGVERCPRCKQDVMEFKALGGGKEAEILVGDNTANYVERARFLVHRYVSENVFNNAYQEFEVYVVWFCKILTGWKALVATNLSDGMYYEVTYNGVKQETYLDAYRKVENVVIPD